MLAFPLFSEREIKLEMKKVSQLISSNNLETIICLPVSRELKIRVFAGDDMMKTQK